MGKDYRPLILHKLTKRLEKPRASLAEIFEKWRRINEKEKALETITSMKAKFIHIGTKKINNRTKRDDLMKAFFRWKNMCRKPEEYYPKITQGFNILTKYTKKQLCNEPFDRIAISRNFERPLTKIFKSYKNQEKRLLNGKMRNLLGRWRKKFDEKRDELSGFKEKDLADFVTIKSQKRVSTFDDKTTQIVFGDNQPTICYFGVKGEKWDEAEKLLDKIADKAMEKKLKVTMTEIKEGMGRRIAEYIGVKEADLPSIRIIDTRKELKKYIMEKEINEENILEFIAGWEKGILKRHLKTQEEPKENKGPILEVVGKTFKRDVLENDKDVMIVFYAPWCGHCKKLLPEYEKAANKLKEKNPKVLLAKMDATENEVEGIEVTGFPTIKFYPGNKKDARPKDYSGDRTMDGIIKYLKTNCVNKLVLDEEETDKKDEKDGKTADL